MTIENERAFLDGIWDWAILDGCFGDTRIKPTDIDGMTERNGHFLMLECKAPGVPVKQGQAILIRRLVETGFFTVMIVWGQQNQPEKLRISGTMGDREIDPCNIELFRHYVALWFDQANQQKPGIITTPLLTRKVIQMFDDLHIQISTNNRLLLQLLAQTRSVKPVKRGNVVSMSHDLPYGDAA